MISFKINLEVIDNRDGKVRHFYKSSQAELVTKAISLFFMFGDNDFEFPCERKSLLVNCPHSGKRSLLKKLNLFINIMVTFRRKEGKNKLENIGLVSSQVNSDLT